MANIKNKFNYLKKELDDIDNDIENKLKYLETNIKIIKPVEIYFPYKELNKLNDISCIYLELENNKYITIIIKLFEEELQIIRLIHNDKIYFDILCIFKFDEYIELDDTMVLYNNNIIEGYNIQIVLSKDSLLFYSP